MSVSAASTGIPVPVRTRREFCTRACQTLSAAAVGSLVSGCAGSGFPAGPSEVQPGSGSLALSAVASTVSGRTVSVPIDPAGVLGGAGSAALVESALGVFLVSRSSASAFSVLTAICTHEGCTVTGFNGQLYVCPCHNSKYTTNGSVANGPASQPLRQFSSTFAGGVLTFSV